MFIDYRGLASCTMSSFEGQKRNDKPMLERSLPRTYHLNGAENAGIP